MNNEEHDSGVWNISEMAHMKNRGYHGSFCSTICTHWGCTCCCGAIGALRPAGAMVPMTRTLPYGLLQGVGICIEPNILTLLP